MPPPHRLAIQSINGTDVVLNLGQWSSGGCAIHYFDIKRRTLQVNVWSSLYEKYSISKNRKELLLRKFIPDTTYSILVTARNDAGITREEYEVKIPPLYWRKSSKSPYATMKDSDGKESVSSEEVPLYRNLAFVLPITLSLLVILCLFMLACWCISKHNEPIYNHYSGKMITKSWFPRLREELNTVFWSWIRFSFYPQQMIWARGLTHWRYPNCLPENLLIQRYHPSLATIKQP